MKRSLLTASLAMVLLGCGRRVEQYVLPDQIADFSSLYATNCSGCHGVQGRSGAARSLNDTLFIALIGKDNLRDVIAKGVAKTAMPGFAQNAGGSLTDRQISILAEEIEAQWSKPISALDLLPYRAELGDAAKGQIVFDRHCKGCHTEKGVGGSLVSPEFLTLVSDQSLRTSVIAGRADRGMPNWRGHDPAMTAQDVSDVVAMLSALRPRTVNLTTLGANLP